MRHNIKGAFGSWPYLQHAIAPTTASAIIELGFLTTAGDRKVILEQQDRVASGIANGIVRFLTRRQGTRDGESG